MSIGLRRHIFFSEVRDALDDAASRVRRKVRCDVCDDPIRQLHQGWSRQEPTFLRLAGMVEIGRHLRPRKIWKTAWHFEESGRPGLREHYRDIAFYLCASCRSRYELELARTLEPFEAWLGGDEFVEVWDGETAARDFARESFPGMAAADDLEQLRASVPSGYEGVLAYTFTHQYFGDYDRHVKWVGSVSRMDDGNIARLWRPVAVERGRYTPD